MQSTALRAEALNLIYQSALEPERWGGALATVAASFGAVGATMLPLNQPSLCQVSPSLIEAGHAYADTWWQLDAMVRYMVAQKTPLGIYRDWEFVPSDVRIHDPFYQDFRRHYDLGSSIGIISQPFEAELYSIALQYSFARADPHEHDVAEFVGVARHVSRSVAIGSKIKRHQDTADLLLETLWATSHAVAIVQADGRVVFANPTASGQQDAFRVSRTGLRCARSGDQAALDSMIKGALDPTSPPTGPDRVAIRRARSAKPLIVRAIPFGPRGGRCALIVAVDPDKPVPPSVESSLRLMGLTTQEARIAARVGMGQTLVEIGVALSLSAETVRTYVKHVLRKLDLKRQAELAALVVRLGEIG